MKHAFIWICLFVLMGCVAKNQPLTTSYTSPDYFILNDGIRFFEMDPLGNIYIVDESERISKFDTTGQLMYNVVNNQLGEIHSIDVGNPFKILAFYRDQQHLVLFDNTLSEIQRIPLIEWDLHDVTAANLSPDNAIWLFNGENKVLMKMTDKGDPMTMSDPFDILGTPSARPDFIFDAGQFLLVKEAGKPLAVFDDFGSYIRAFDAGENFSISDKEVIYSTPEGYLRHDLPGNKTIPYYVNADHIDRKVFYHHQRLYAKDEKGIYILNHLP